MLRVPCVVYPLVTELVYSRPWAQEVDNPDETRSVVLDLEYFENLEVRIWAVKNPITSLQRDSIPVNAFRIREGSAAYSWNLA